VVSEKADTGMQRVAGSREHTFISEICQNGGRARSENHFFREKGTLISPSNCLSETLAAINGRP